ncbi:MAG TPA: class I SAM-dependent methyltransferase [Pyrinomonadaceae bacterium]|nr:class I SAM-dependent methyltransferase [Pyrinomonadaceae bacterium]
MTRICAPVPTLLRSLVIQLRRKNVALHFCAEFYRDGRGTAVAIPVVMYQPISIPSTPYSSPQPLELAPLSDVVARPRNESRSGIFHGLWRRLSRERRRRKVGRSYDMALEVALMIPAGARVLDIGCGNGYIAHHLSGMRNAKVTGIDLQRETEAQIRYLQYDGVRFPVEKTSVDTALLCYVLHHTQDLQTVLLELRRVLRNGGSAIIYEDIPDSAWDRMLCSIHDLKWRGRTGPCTFRTSAEWRQVFKLHGFEIVTERSLSRWRNLAYPVSRRCYFLRVRK